MKKKILTLITGVFICMNAVLLTGCSDMVSKYLGEETVDTLASKGKSIASDEASIFVSNFKESSSEIISETIEAAKQKKQELDKEYNGGDGIDSTISSFSSMPEGILSSTEDINLRDVDGNGRNYAFTYGDEEFIAVYWTEHWKILDSYKISSSDDMMIICQALIDEHPVHGSGMESFREADDMAYEWLQHNLAYAILPEDNVWRQKSKDVDFNPEDQGKTFYEIYEQRTGKEFKLSDFFGG